jgi:peptidoglycan hydrolase CwlO-like protein
MTKITLRQAVEQFDVSRPTLTKSLKSGKISGEKDAKGVWSVDPSELSRVYNPRHKEQESEQPSEQHKNTPDFNYLQGKVDALEAQIEDIKEQRDKAEERASNSDARLYGLLQDMRPAPSLLQRMFGRKSKG